jgi:hypothetical protein
MSDKDAARSSDAFMARFMALHPRKIDLSLGQKDPHASTIRR